MGNENTYEYDAMGKLVRSTDAIGAVAQYVYNRQGLLVEHIDALGKVWRFEYDLGGRLVRYLDPLGFATMFEWGPEGRLARFVDPSGTGVRFEYFAGRTPENPAPGRLERIIFPTFTQERQYDARGRLVAESRIDGEGERVTTTHEYDRKGNLVATTNPDGRVERFEYDAHDRLVTRILTNGSVVAIDRDRWDNFVGVTDPRGNRVELRFDLLGRRISESRAGGGVTSFEYDGTGNLVHIADPRELVVAYTYDGAGRRVEERTYASASESTATRTIEYSYNGRGDLVGYVDGELSGSFTVDALGRRTAESTNYGAFFKGEQQTYDERGLVSTFTSPDGVTYAYDYDAAGRLRMIDIPGEGKITYQSYAWNVPETVLLPGGTVQEFEYDDFQQMTRARSVAPGGGVIMDQSYERDVTGRVIAKQTETGNYTYGYDAAYQLTSAISDELPDEEYVYDPAGNRLPADPLLQVEWIYDEDNQLVTTDTTTYEYDAAGNRVREVGPEGERRFFWDEYSRLQRIEDGSGQVIASYAYDPFARRLWKEVEGSRTYFAYANEGLVSEFDAVGAVARSYSYKPGSPYTTAPVFQHTEAWLFYHNDQLGTPQMLTNKGGVLVWSARYTSHGEAESGVQASANPLRFPGHYRDDETGIHQNWHRSYDPAVGRYMTQDPLGVLSWLRAESTAMIVDGDYNLYVYARHDPINRIDPMGLRSGTGSIVLDCVAWLRMSETEHRGRNRLNSCPRKPPTPGEEDCEGRMFTKSWGKWREDDGSECLYGADGAFDSNVSFNFSPPPYEFVPPNANGILHLCADVITHFTDARTRRGGSRISGGYGLTRLYDCPCDE